jgi:hypothetical protein
LAHWYKEQYGTFPYSFNIHDIVKGIIFGVAGYGNLKLFAKPPKTITAKDAAISGAFMGVVGGLEDFLDAVTDQYLQPEVVGRGDPTHEFFQSIILNTLISTATCVGINELTKIIFK